jgi:Putative adhesin
MRGAWVVVLLAGCALGYRGEAAFTGEHALEGTHELRIDLPDTPLTVVACAADDPRTCPATLRYDGVWLSVAGSAQDARDAATAPTLVFERDPDRGGSAQDPGFATLRAAIPLAVDGTLDLELGTIALPDDRHLDLRTGLGDVSVRGSVASVIVDVGVGDVEVRGADGGLAIRTGQGDLDVVTPGHADLTTGEGHVSLEQSGSPRDLRVSTAQGDIRVVLASDADVDLEIHTRGRITVRTPSITTVGSGRFARRNGDGSIRIELRSPRGDIDVTQR